jgi:regulator of sigma E protease
VEGDRIYAVEVPQPEGGRKRWVNRGPVPAIVDARDQTLDTVRLPFELNEWATRRGPGDKVTLTLLRTKDHELSLLKVELPWDDRFLYSNETGLGPESVMAIGGLGIAYRVDTMVESVLPGGPAARGTTRDGQLFPLQQGDHITAIRTYAWDPDGVPTQPERDIFLEPGGWAYAEQVVQMAEAKRFELKVERGGVEYEVTLNAEEDQSWPVTERGLPLQLDTQIQRAHDPSSAIFLGVRRLYLSTSTILESIVAWYQRRVSPQNFAGPVRIAQVARRPEGIAYFFNLYLALFAGANVLVALANLLPIPGCDAGSLLRALLSNVQK